MIRYNNNFIGLMKYFPAPPPNAPRGILSDYIFAFWTGRFCENTKINDLITV